MEKILAKIILRALAHASVSEDDSQFRVCRRAANLACNEYAQPALEEPVYYLILQAWNDIQDWANEQLITENTHIDYFEAGNAVMDSMDEKKT